MAGARQKGRTIRLQIGEYMIYFQFYCVTWKGVVIQIFLLCDIGRNLAGLRMHDSWEGSIERTSMSASLLILLSDDAQVPRGAGGGRRGIVEVGGAKRWDIGYARSDPLIVPRPAPARHCSPAAL